MRHDYYLDDGISKNFVVWRFPHCVVGNHRIVIQKSLYFDRPVRTPATHVYVSCETCHYTAWVECE